MDASAHYRIDCESVRLVEVNEDAIAADPSLVALQLLSVISMLSSETPNTDSPANVDAAKQVRGRFRA